jgi:mannose-6-phosphate isomerase-like protein (cupin superfamily)
MPWIYAGRRRATAEHKTEHKSGGQASAHSARRILVGDYDFEVARYDTVRFDELDGTVKKVRQALGVMAFGVNYFDLPAGAEGLEHNETRSNQEEVYVYVKGSGRLRVGNDEIEVREGIAVRVDPDVTRQPIAGEKGLAWVAIGAPRDGTYEPPSWG